MSDFYKQSTDTLYRGTINYSVLTDAQLSVEAAKGIELYNKLFPPKDFVESMGPVIAVGLIVFAATAAVSMVSAGTSAATQAAQVATTNAAASAGASSSGLWGAVKSTAQYISSAGAGIKKAIGINPIEKITNAADLITSGSMGDAIKKGTDYLLKSQNVKIDKKNKAATSALDEMIKREQEKQRLLLMQDAQSLAREQGVQAPQISATPPKRDWLAIASVATPFILLLLKS